MTIHCQHGKIGLDRSHVPSFRALALGIVDQTILCVELAGIETLFLETQYIRPSMALIRDVGSILTKQEHTPWSLVPLSVVQSVSGLFPIEHQDPGLTGFNEERETTPE
jgi:hypothetical protein